MLKHSFVSPAQDGADQNKLQPSHWNAEHAFADGEDGQVLVRDSSQSGGARWANVTGLTEQEGLLVFDDDPRLTDARTPLAHTHPSSDISDLDDLVFDDDPRLSDSRLPLSHSHAWTDISKSGSSLADLATRPHSYLTGIGTDDHHPQAHAFAGGDHTGLSVSSPSSGQVIRFTGSAWANATLVKNDLPSAIAYEDEANTFSLQQTFGSHLLPSTPYTSDIGALTMKFRALHAAELWVETLVAQETIATIGGRILVGPTTTLAADISSESTIYLKHNSPQAGDILYMEAGGQVEFMSVTSGPTGTGPYAYVVSRGLNGNYSYWSAGDAVFNTGQTGSGFIDLYSVRGVKAATELGPTIVGNVRTGSGYAAWEPRWAIGNLRGLYGYSADDYGVAFGDPDGSWVKIDDSNGVRLGNGSTVNVQITPAGVASFAGSVTITGGSGYGNLSDKPTALSSINSGEGSKLSGIEAGADVTGDHVAANTSYVGTIPATTVSGWSYDGSTYIDGGNIYTGTVTAAKLAADLAIVSTLRSSGATAVGTGAGFWLDASVPTPTFRVGDPSGDFLKWDGSELSIASAYLSIDSDGIRALVSTALADGRAYTFESANPTWGGSRYGMYGYEAGSTRYLGVLSDSVLTGITSRVDILARRGAPSIQSSGYSSYFGDGGCLNQIWGSTETWGGVEIKDGYTLDSIYGRANFTVDTDVFKVDGVNDRVGVGLASPIVKFQVRTATDVNLGIRTGETDTSAAQLNAFNNAGSANIPLEFKASKFNFTTGSVGIGAASPASTLQIGSVGSTGYSGNHIAFGDGTRAAAFLVDSTAAWFYASGAMIFAPGSSEKVRILSDGKVGIGTSSPTSPLYVVGNVSADSFTDRTPYYDGDAVAELLLVASDKKGGVDHATLPSFARKKDGEEDARDLGAMISILTVAVQQLAGRLSALESGRKAES